MVSPAPQPAAYPSPGPGGFSPPYGPAESDDAPCEHTAAAPYGEHIVYERYERTVTPPPQAAPAPASQHISY